MNKKLIAKKVEEYEMLTYNEIINEINLSIKEAKAKKLNPLETYRLIQSKLETLEQEIIDIFPVSENLPLSEDILEKIDGYVDTYATKAYNFTKEEVIKKVNNLCDDDYVDLYDYLKKLK